MPNMNQMRPSQRQPDEMRKVTIERGIAPKAEGSCLIAFGSTRVLVTASVDFLDGTSARTIEDVTGRLQSVIKARFPEVRHLFIEVQSEDTFKPAAVTLH